MELRTAASPKDVKHYTTERLREEFLIPQLFVKNQIKLVYSHVDRMITGAATPVEKELFLTAGEELRAAYFLQRRELGLINIGGKGTVTMDGTVYEVEPRDGMYIGKGKKEISFASADPEKPAKFYLNSTPAHTTYPTVLIKREHLLTVWSSLNRKTRWSLEHWKNRIIAPSTNTFCLDRLLPASLRWD